MQYKQRFAFSVQTFLAAPEARATTEIGGLFELLWSPSSV